MGGLTRPTGDTATPDLSVIIVSWNTCGLLRDCVTSVLGASLDLQVIVVDNGSTDGSPEMLAREAPSVTVIQNEKNLGFAAASNQGLGMARGRYCLLLNTDTVVLHKALAMLVQYMDSHPSTGACGPQLLNADGSLQPSGHAFPNLASTLAELLPVPARWRQAAKGPLEKRDYSAMCGVDEISGAAFCVRGETMAQVGLLDEAYFFLGEDVDWCWRIKQAGWSIDYVPQAQVVHYGGGSTRRDDKAWLLASRAYYRLFSKHRTRRQAALLRLVLSLLVPVRMLGKTTKAALYGDRAGAQVSARLHCETFRDLWRSSRGAA
jgi:GT2 family glycosyltransferase